MEQVHSLVLDLNWELVKQLSALDRFDAAWTSIEKREGASLGQLRSVETVRSVGASTRIEGSRLTDAEVEALLRKIEITQFEDRDTQEVVGYYEVLDFILDGYSTIQPSAGDVKNLHGMLLKHCERDTWHRGNYKVQSNIVEATMPDGSKHTLFKTSDPGFPTEDAMCSLLEWYAADKRTHPLVRSALFTYEFLSIHPFQDGNGRLSRLLTTLLLLQHGYSWIQYVSFEHEIESRKSEYYRVLRSCQSARPGEDVSPWLRFFLDALLNVQQKLEAKLTRTSSSAAFGPRERAILALIGERPGIKSGEVAERLDIPLPTVKKDLSRLIEAEQIVRHGRGPGTNYNLV